MTETNGDRKPRRRLTDADHLARLKGAMDRDAAQAEKSAAAYRAYIEGMRAKADALRAQVEAASG